jgi:hypothetical protein
MIQFPTCDLKNSDYILADYAWTDPMHQGRIDAYR